MNSPADDMAQELDTDSTLGLTFGTDLFVGHLPATPDKCVCVYDSGGYDPLHMFVYDRPTIQVRVRGDKGDYQDAYTLARDIRTTLSAISNYQYSSTTYYVGVWAQGDIVSLGHDTNGRPEFTVNFRIHRST